MGIKEKSDCPSNSYTVGVDIVVIKYSTLSLLIFDQRINSNSSIDYGKLVRILIPAIFCILSLSYKVHYHVSEEFQLCSSVADAVIYCLLSQSNKMWGAWMEMALLVLGEKQKRE